MAANERFGLVAKDDPPEIIEKYFQLLKGVYLPYTKPGKYAVESVNPFKLMMEFKNSLDLFNRPPPPREFLLLDRANLGLFTKLSQWKARVNWMESSEKYITPRAESRISELEQD